LSRVQGTKTEKNLWTAFAGESQARSKYTYFAQQARKEGYPTIAQVFMETAEHELQHAKRMFKFLEGIGDTPANLEAAAEGENYEYSKMYKEFAQTAKEEGFQEIAAVFLAVARSEEGHEERYLKYLKELKEESLFKSEKPQMWRCTNCGYLHEGDEAPEVCPACAHGKAFFQPYNEVR